MKSVDYYNRSWTTSFDKDRLFLGDIELAKQHIDQVNLLSKQDTILEIGCGAGHLTNLLFNEGYQNIVGVDLSSVAINYGRKKYSNLTFSIMNGQNLGFTNQTFQACLSFDFIEHVDSVTEHLTQVYRVLKPKGVYIFQTPNIFTNIPIEIIRTKSFNWRDYHPSLQTWWSLNSKLLATGFKHTHFNKIPPLSHYKINKLPRIVKPAFEKFPWNKLPLWLQLGFYGVATK